MNSTTATTSLAPLGFTFVADDVDHYKRFDWIFPVSVSIVLMIMTSYILASLVYYAVKTRKWCFYATGGRTEALNSGFIYVSVLVCATLCLFRFAVSLGFMNAGYREGDHRLCNHLADAAYSAYASVLLTRAMFLWLRQRAFYANKMLNVGYNRTVKFFSFTSIFIILVYGVSVVIHAMVPQDYQASIKGCIYRPDHELQAGYWVPALVGIAFMNILLLGLFLHAIVHVKFAENKRKQKNRSQPGQNEPGLQSIPLSSADVLNAYTKSRCKRSSYVFKKRTLSFIKTRNKVKKVLQHTFLFAIISFTCDIFAQVFSNLIIAADDHRRYSYLIFDIIAMVYLLLIIFSFNNFKKMLFSFFFPLSRNSMPPHETS